MSGDEWTHPAPGGATAYRAPTEDETPRTDAADGRSTSTALDRRHSDDFAPGGAHALNRAEVAGGPGFDGHQMGVYVPPETGPSDLAGLPGPFTPRQLSRIDEALTVGSDETGLLFSVYVGELGRPGRAAAEKLAARLPTSALAGSVLLAVSPGQRELHIVTVAGATKRVPNRVCALAAVGMRTAFAGGDLTAGIVNGVRMLADAAGVHSDGRHSTGQAAGGR